MYEICFAPTEKLPRWQEESVAHYVACSSAAFLGTFVFQKYYTCEQIVLLTHNIVQARMLACWFTPPSFTHLLILSPTHPNIYIFSTSCSRAAVTASTFQELTCMHTRKTPLVSSRLPNLLIGSDTDKCPYSGRRSKTDATRAAA